MEIKLTLSKKTGTFSVDGKTLQEAKNKLGPLEWGHFQPIAGSVKATTKAGKVVSVELIGGYRIEMPVWSGYTGSPSVCKAEWDRMWKALETHEQAHAALYMEGIFKLRDKLESIPPGTIDDKQLDKLLRDAMADMEQNQDVFETNSDRGRKRGVTLDPPGECM